MEYIKIGKSKKNSNNIIKNGSLTNRNYYPNPIKKLIIKKLIIIYHRIQLVFLLILKEKIYQEEIQTKNFQIYFIYQKKMIMKK